MKWFPSQRKHVLWLALTYGFDCTFVFSWASVTTLLCFSPTHSNTIKCIVSQCYPTNSISRLRQNTQHTLLLESAYLRALHLWYSAIAPFVRELADYSTLWEPVQVSGTLLLSASIHHPTDMPPQCSRLRKIHGNSSCIVVNSLSSTIATLIPPVITLALTQLKTLSFFSLLVVHVAFLRLPQSMLKPSPARVGSCHP